MKRGQKVAVCQDGKWGRAVAGVITKTHNGNRIKVKFSVNTSINNSDNWQVTEVEHWFRASRRSSKYGGMRKLFSGWCDIPGTWCPWYSVIPIKRITASGLRIEGVNV